MISAAGCSRSTRGNAFRRTILPCMTLVVAGALAWGAHYWADRVRYVNSYRTTAGLLAASLVASSSSTHGAPTTGQAGGALPMLRFPFPPPNVDTAPADARSDDDAASAPPSTENLPSVREVLRQSGYLETLVYLWERIMWGAAAVIAALAVLSLLTRWGRALHLVAAILLLLSTAVTLAVLIKLVDPLGGGLPALPLQTYLAVAVVQSAYGWLLIVVFRWKASPGCTGTEPPRPLS